MFKLSVSTWNRTTVWNCSHVADNIFVCAFPNPLVYRETVSLPLCLWLIIGAVRIVKVFQCVYKNRRKKLNWRCQPGKNGKIGILCPSISHLLHSEMSIKYFICMEIIPWHSKLVLVLNMPCKCWKQYVILYLLKLSVIFFNSVNFSQQGLSLQALWCYNTLNCFSVRFCTAPCGCLGSAGISLEIPASEFWMTFLIIVI